MNSTISYLMQVSFITPFGCKGGHVPIPPWIGGSCNKIADSVSNLGRGATESAGGCSLLIRARAIEVYQENPAMAGTRRGS